MWDALDGRFVVIQVRILWIEGSEYTVAVFCSSISLPSMVQGYDPNTSYASEPISGGQVNSCERRTDGTCQTARWGYREPAR